jgi:alkylation response protein AidB-like acyl-CoA dehydrogenase
MDFEFSETQDMLRSTVSRYLAENYDFETRRRSLRANDGRVPGLWQALAAELGILAIPFDENLGGLGGGAIETMVVMEEIGKALLVEPYVETMVIASGILKRVRSAVSESVIAAIMRGETVVAFAHGEPQITNDLAVVRTKAIRNGASYSLTGHKAVVRGAPWAQYLIVTARTCGDDRDRRGISLFLVDADAPGIDARSYETIDGARTSELRFENVVVPVTHLLGEPDVGLPVIERVIDEAVAANCAEAVGCMSSMLAQTVEYASHRRQFGAPISSFQVLRHRMVDMYVAVEQAVSMTYGATLMLDASDRERSKATSAAKVLVGKSCRYVGESAIQIHGGMGITDDLAIGHYFRRVTVLDTQFGSAAHHLRRFASF